MCSLQKYENFPLASITFEQPFNPKRVDELLKSKVITVEDRFILKKLSKLKQPVNLCILEPPSNGWGRYQTKKPTVSLFNLSRKTRHYLCREHYTDFDIVKSQPNVMYSYYKTNGFKTTCLEKYITNPDKWIECVMTEFSYEAGEYDKVYCDRKEIAKKLFTSICNLGSFKSWLEKYKVKHNESECILYFFQLSKEMKTNIELAKQIEPQLWSDVTQILLAKKDKTYPESSFSAYLYHELERRILESLFSDGEEYTTGVYSLDGLMIPVSAMNGLSIEEYCKTFNQRVVEVFGDGYKNVRMISKAMDEAHIIEFSQNDTSKLEDDETDETELELTWNMVNTYSQTELAEFYSRIVEQRYVFSNNCWYWWNSNNIIQRGNKNHPDSLKVEFHDEMNSRLDKLIKNLDKTDEAYREKIKTALAFHKRMGQSTSVNGIIDYLRSYYSDENFSKKVDTNMNLFAFTNCLYDHTIKKIRPIKKHDYIMKNTGYDYNLAKQEDKDFIMTQLLNMMDRKEMVDYLLDTLAVALVDNTHEQFYCHTGTGGNGKGLLFTLLRNSLGQYYYQAPSEFYTTPYRADAPNSSLSKAKGCRFFVTSEPSSEDTGGRKMKLSTDLIKTLTGRDPINARDLYLSAEEFIPTFTSFLQCNTIPEMKIDGGMRRRFRKLDYPNCFVENPNPDKPKEKQIDVSLKDKFALYQYHIAFMEILFDRLKSFTKFVIPQSTIDSTNAKMDDMDYVGAWLNDFTETSVGNSYHRTESYLDFLKDMGLTKFDMSNTSFFSKMEGKDVRPAKIHGIRYFKDIKKKPEPPKPEEAEKCRIEKDL